MWDPRQYLRFGDERARPFLDLLNRVGAQEPGWVVDLGCGPGHLTATLAERWPGAEVLGLDSSAAMIEAATAQVRGDLAGAGRLRFELCDIRDWRPERSPDVIVSNAVLQWVEDHLDVLVRWAGLLSVGGWLAIQVPGNFDQPSHAILRDMAESRRWRSRLSEVRLNRQAATPAEYVDILSRDGCVVDAWETTYLHVLQGENPVLEWYKGTGLRPVFEVLCAEDAAEFAAEYGARIREAYPAAPYGTVFAFRRVFAVARRAE